MKKTSILYILAVVISLCSSMRLYAEEIVDSVCVVIVSRSEDGKIRFEANGGFVDPAEEHPESYLFTNRKYIKFLNGEGVSASDGYRYQKQNDQPLQNFKVYKDNFQERDPFKNLAKFNHDWYISPIGLEASCIVAGNQLNIRRCAVLDSLDVTISYRYGSKDEPQDSTIMQRLPVGTDVKYDIAESACKFRVDVRRPVFGKVSEVIYDKKDIHAVDDNYFSGKSFQGTPADTIQNIIINSYTIDDKYQEVPNTLSISFNRVKESKGLPEWLKSLMIFVALFAVFALCVWLAFYFYKGGIPYVKKAKNITYTDVSLSVGEKFFLPEEIDILPWKVGLKTMNGKTEDLLPTHLQKCKSFKVNSTQYSEFTVSDSKGPIKKYKPSFYPELHVERNDEKRIILCSLNGTTGKNTILDTPRVSLKSDNGKVVRIVLGNQIEAVSVGEANIYCIADKKYGWHVVVSELEAEKTEIPDPADIEMRLGAVEQNAEVTVAEVSEADKTIAQPTVVDESDMVDMARMSLLQNFCEQVMAAVEIDSKKILADDLGAVDNEIQEVVKRISKDRAMYKMVDSHFSDRFDAGLGRKKEDTYAEVISGLKEDAGHFITLMNSLGETDFSRAIDAIEDNHRFIADVCETIRCESACVKSSIAALKEVERQYCDLKKYISDKLQFASLSDPNDLIDEAARHVAEYNSLYAAKQAVDASLYELQKKFEETSKKLSEVQEKYASADNVHINNRKFYLEKLGEVLDVLDSSLTKISSNVLSSADCAEMVKGIYASANGFKSFYAYVNNEDWNRYDQLTDIRDTIASRLNGAIAYERSWVNGVARFHAYLRVPQLETYLAAFGLSRRDFETAYNAMNLLYTAFFEYKSLVLPSLFVDVYNPDVHDYDEQSVGNVISVVCSTYDSFRDSHSKLCDFNKIGYIMTDGTVVKPEVIF